MTNATNADNYAFIGFPATEYTAAADCKNSRVTLTTYINGAQYGGTSVLYGEWLTGGGCNYAPSITFPHGYGEIRVAVSVEHLPALKGALFWTQVPLAWGVLPKRFGGP